MMFLTNRLEENEVEHKHKLAEKRGLVANRNVLTNRFQV